MEVTIMDVLLIYKDTFISYSISGSWLFIIWFDQKRSFYRFL